MRGSSTGAQADLKGKAEALTGTYGFLATILCQTRKHLIKCIGDAVPPMLAYAPALGAIAAISGH